MGEGKESMSAPRFESGPAHEKISSTAKFVAYLRTYDEILYANEIADSTDARAVFEQFSEGDEAIAERFAPLFEARHKTVNHVLERYDVNQVLELASGISPRGIAKSADSGVLYVETDLNPIISEKKQIIERILESKHAERQNLHFAELNITNEQQFDEVTRRFSPEAVAVVSEEGPGAVISEGVLLYLNREEIEAVAKNIHGFLSKRGGVWITDVVTQESMRKFTQADPKIRRVIELVSGITDRSLENNPFKDEDNAREFFENQGFKIKMYSQADIVHQLSSIDRLGLDRDKVRQQLAPRKIWAMEPK